MFVRLIILGTVVLSTSQGFARDNDVSELHSKCASELTPLPSTSKVSVSINGEAKDFLFHNPEIAGLINGPLTAPVLEGVLRQLLHKGTFEIPSNNGGFVTAADVGDHPGNYGLYLWLRDFARVFKGTISFTRLLEMLKAPEAERARKVERERARAAIEILSDSWWTHQALLNIQQPGLHMDPHYGQQSGIWVRRLAAPFREHRPPTEQETYKESDWGHRQNDAIASYALTIFDALDAGVIQRSDMTLSAKQNLVLLAPYFVNLAYWKMWDMGAWEEQPARRSHSIGLVTSLLERFVEEFPNEPDVDYLSVRNAIDSAYRLLNTRLTGDRLVESDEGTLGSNRFEDTALSHLVWWPMRNFETSDYLKMIAKLDVLKRESGYARYRNDWFLYGPAEVARHAGQMGLYGFFTTQWDQDRVVATPDQIRRLADLHAQHISDKDMQEIVEIAGEKLEAQWTLPDSILSAYYSDLYLKSRQPSHLESAKEHFIRALGLITGSSDITSEGQSVQAYKLPEAYLPVPLMIDGQIRVVYFTSPNSPLNWSTAEFTVAAEKLLLAFRQSEQKH